MDPKRFKTITVAVELFSHLNHMLKTIISILLVAISTFTVMAVVPPSAPAPDAPNIAPASPDAETQIRSFQIPKDFSTHLFAAEPMMANPVAFTVDNQGRVWVCESFRQNRGVTDNREHNQQWLERDISALSVQDRIDYHKELLGAKLSEYTKYDDQIRLLEDKDQDGKADYSTVYAKHFNQIEDGTAAGILVRGNSVYMTCIPHLWQLEDTDHDNLADKRKALHSGYGVRVAFRGHDSHGLIMGPDGRLYFSIGDRGYNIEFEGQKHFDPRSGAVFRCEPDGSDLEVFATGLRNPQELAFDQYGNLFTGDNNSDSGDRARWVHVVQDGDTGWRMEYQYLSDRGPFNREKIWHPYNEDTPAYIVPPIRNFADGPSGLVYYPGTGMPNQFNDTFLLCDFRGGPNNSGVRSLKVEPNGATFKVVENAQPFWKILATDIAFAPAGGIYLSDWVNGWNGEGKGRIYHFKPTSEEVLKTAQETTKLLSQDWSKLKPVNLEALLSHADYRVRLESQLELVNRKSHVVFTKVLTESDNVLAQLHSLWGMGILARHGFFETEVKKALLNFLSEDYSIELRSQVLNLLGDLQVKSAEKTLLEVIKADDARLKFFAAKALGKIQSQKAFGAFVTLLEENQDQDPVLRHAGIMGLVGTDNAEQIVQLKLHASRSVRVAAVVALRRLEDPSIAQFLDDTDARIVLEAARAIHDLPIVGALEALANAESQITSHPETGRRILNANFRLGTAERADLVARIAGDSQVHDSLRTIAIEMLANWTEPSARDHVLGFWRPLEKRDRNIARVAMINHLGGILSGSDLVRSAGIKTAASLGIEEAGPILMEVLINMEAEGQSRAVALSALGAIKHPDFKETVARHLEDEIAEVRIQARHELISIDATKAVSILEAAIESKNLIERQAAFRDLALLDSDAAANVLLAGVERLKSNQLPADTRVDVRVAARHSQSEAVKNALADYEASLDANDVTAQFLDSLEGGNAERGKKIFYERTQVSCVRCHKFNGRGGDVGPVLDKLGQEKSRKYLLEAIVEPNAAIAKNFESLTIVDLDGIITTGVVKSNNDESIELLTAEGKRVEIAKDNIDFQKQSKSPMPEDLVKHLSLDDVRDLVEFLKLGVE